MSVVGVVSKIYEVGREELESFRGQLEQVGLSLSEPELVVHRDDPEIFTAEFKVEFLDRGNLVDIFEFFVCRGGVAVVDAEEVRHWIRENVPDVLARRSLALSTEGEGS